MSWPHIAIYLVVMGIGLPAALRNPTALALVMNWAVGEFTWMVTGDNLPLKVYFMADVAVLAVICAKAIRQEGGRTYSSLKQQLIRWGKALTIWDRLIASSYILLVWPAYVLSFDAYTKWYLLWGLLIAQFLLAGGEAVQSLLDDRKGSAMTRPPGGQDLAFARDWGRV